MTTIYCIISMIQDFQSHHGDGWSEQKQRTFAPFLYLFLIFTSLLLNHVLHVTEIHSSISGGKKQHRDWIKWSLSSSEHAVGSAATTGAVNPEREAREPWKVLRYLRRDWRLFLSQAYYWLMSATLACSHNAKSETVVSTFLQRPGFITTSRIELLHSMGRTIFRDNTLVTGGQTASVFLKLGWIMFTSFYCLDVGRIICPENSPVCSPPCAKSKRSSTVTRRQSSELLHLNLIGVCTFPPRGLNNGGEANEICYVWNTDMHTVNIMTLLCPWLMQKRSASQWDWMRVFFVIVCRTWQYYSSFESLHGESCAVKREPA